MPHPFEPDADYKDEGRNLLFAALHGMAELDQSKVTAGLPTISHAGLQWAFIYMGQSYFEAIHVACGRDDACTAEVIAEYVRRAEEFQAVRDAFEAPSAEK